MPSREVDLGIGGIAPASPQPVLPPEQTMLQLTLRFDGSLRGVCGGAGAILVHDQQVVWQGARFLPRCATSVAAEYEGLLLGMTAARELGATGLHTEGDCKVVLRQLSGSARARKLHRLCTQAEAIASSFGAPATFAHIPREENDHADALSRAAVDAMVALHCAAVRASLRGGQPESALHLLAEARRQNVPRPPRLFEDLICGGARAAAWGVTISAFTEAESCGAANSDAAIDAALEAYAARGTPLDTKRRAALLRRQAALLAQRNRRAPGASSTDATASSAQADAQGGKGGETTGGSRWARRDPALEEALAAEWWQMVRTRAGDGAPLEDLAGWDARPSAVLLLASQLASPLGLSVHGPVALTPSPMGSS